MFLLCSVLKYVSCKYNSVFVYLSPSRTVLCFLLMFFWHTNWKNVAISKVAIKFYAKCTGFRVIYLMIAMNVYICMCTVYVHEQLVSVAQTKFVFFFAFFPFRVFKLFVSCCCLSLVFFFQLALFCSSHYDI